MGFRIVNTNHLLKTYIFWRIAHMIRFLDKRTVEVNLPSKIGYERVAMECSAALARLAGLVATRVEDVKSAVAEACINAMQHGNQWRPEARVVVHMSYNDDSFKVTVRDQGNGVPGALPEHPADPGPRPHEQRVCQRGGQELRGPPPGRSSR